MEHIFIKAEDSPQVAELVRQLPAADQEKAKGCLWNKTCSRKRMTKHEKREDQFSSFMFGLVEGTVCQFRVCLDTASGFPDRLAFKHLFARNVYDRLGLFDLMPIQLTYVPC